MASVGVEDSSNASHQSVRASINPIRSRLDLLVYMLNLTKRGKWLGALKAQVSVLRNAFGSMLCAWIVNGCYSLGNIYSGKQSRDQSRAELMVANSFWATITFSIVMLIARLPSMLSLRFINSPDSRPTVWLCAKKLLRGAFGYFLVTLLVMLGCSAFVAYLVTLNPSIFKYKLDCYVGTLSTHGFFTGLSITVKKIFYHETCQGRDRLLKAQQIAASKEAVLPFRTSCSHRVSRFWRAYVKEFPKSIPAAFAGVFVHILSQQRIMEQSGPILTCFVIGTTLFKLTIQEGTKQYILRKKIRSIKFMCAAVALPTVLIDTQTRIILLGTKNTQMVAMGTVGMAFIEVFLRMIKAIIIIRAIRTREASTCGSRKIKPAPGSRRAALNMGPNSPVAGRLDFELWRRRLQAYHIAEINADTFAEYIAIGCSASILYFFGEHPFYSLLKQSDSSGQRNQQFAQLRMLLFQLVVEVLVDFVSTLLEMSVGIDFELVKDLGAFFTVLFMVTAVLNINISAGIYLF